MSPEEIATRKAEIASKNAIELDGMAHALQRRSMLASAAAELNLKRILSNGARP